MQIGSAKKNVKAEDVRARIDRTKQLQTDADNRNDLEEKLLACSRQVRLSKDVLTRETRGIMRGSDGTGENASVWATIDILQETLRVFDDSLLGSSADQIDETIMASTAFMVNSWTAESNRTGLGNILCSLPEEHVLADSEIRVEELGTDISQGCGEFLTGEGSSKMLEGLRQMFSDASVAIACRRAGLEPTGEEQNPAMLQQKSELSFLTQSNMSAAATGRQLMHWVMQADHRLDYLEAMVPGSKDAVQQHFGSMSSPSLLQLSDADFMERMSVLRQESLTMRGQHPWNRAYHPFRSGGPGTHGYSYDPGWRPWDGWWSRRRRRVYVQPHRTQFKNSRCPGEADWVLNELFNSDTTMDGCSSPTPLLYYSTVTPVCFGHDACYNCNHNEGGQSWCDSQFTGKLASECWRKTWWNGIACSGQAAVMGIAVWAAGGMHSKKGWCTSGCARDVYRYGMTHIYKIDRWY